MAKEFINPNLHVILIHYPLGVFALGVVIELLSFLYRRSSIRTAARWMILIGALSGVPAAITGIYALADVARRSMPHALQDELAGAPWYEVAAAASHPVGRLSTADWEMLEDHAWLQGAATVLSVLVVVIALGCTDRWRQKAYFPFLLLLLISLGIMAAGAWHGGEMVYRNGVAVKLGHGGEIVDATSAGDLQSEMKRGLERYVPPLQIHVLLAGCAVALALAALGLSLRAMATASVSDPEVAGARDLLSMETSQRGAADIDMLRSFKPNAEVTVGEKIFVPASRFWILASLVAILTSAAGWWVLASAAETWRIGTLLKLVGDHDMRRRLVHVLIGGGIIVLPLLMSALALWAPRQKALLALGSLLLVLLVAAQIWFGILLMYDQPEHDHDDASPFYRFRQPPAAQSSTGYQPVSSFSQDMGW